MNRRGFLSTLLLPFLPTPQLPMEVTIIDLPFTSRPMTGFKIIREEIAIAVVNLKAVRKLELYTKDAPMVGDEPAIFNGPWPKVEQF